MQVSMLYLCFVIDTFDMRIYLYAVIMNNCCYFKSNHYVVVYCSMFEIIGRLYKLRFGHILMYFQPSPSSVCTVVFVLVYHRSWIAFAK